MKQKHTATAVATAVVGAITISLFSYTAGLLTAKKSGMETRKDIQKAIDKAKGKI